MIDKRSLNGMTEYKRFNMDIDSNQNIYDTEEKCYYSSIDAKKLCVLLNTITAENKQLKQFQNNTIKLIDKEINKLQKKYEFGQKNGMCPMHNLLHTINTLKNLKTELSE